MARKKKGDAPSAGAPWMNTFADLMNLLLCFFVLLFSMSTVDAEKFEEISISFTNAFGIFDGGLTAIGDGTLMGSGMTQLSNLDEFFSAMGQMSEESGEDITEDDTDSEELDKAKEKIQSEMATLSEEMYDKVSELTKDYSLGDYVELGIDPDSRYVLLTLKGSVLFKSGKAEIMEEAKPILSKIGDVLKKFDGYSIEIVGHTDNVPIKNSTFKDNNWLSTARALNAAEYLIKYKKLDPERIKYSGRGEYEPIASNGTSDGRAKNRRIEIRIYNELSNR